MATLTLFKSKAHNMGYVFRSGKAVHFACGIYATSNKAEIEELTEECEDSGTFYIDPAQLTAESEELDPMSSVRAAQLLSEQAALIAATQGDRDMGTTPQGKLEGISNSNSVKGITASIKVASTKA